MPLQLGQRVAVAAAAGYDRATVRYLGTVHGTNGAWVGVEWDHAARGRHNGSRQGVAYFACRHPTGGSFVRPDKLLVGCDVLTAARLRYAPDQTVEGADLLFAARQVGLHELVHLGLGGTLVDRVGCPGTLAQHLPGVRSVDVSCTLVADWLLLARLAEGLPALHTLDLSDNPLPPTLPGLPVLANLCCLSLNRVPGLTWALVLQLEGHLPALRELHLGACGLATLLPPVEPSEAFQQLQVLGLQDNLLPSWAHVATLGPLPRLHTLLLGGNPFPDVDTTPGGFASLTRLLLAGSSLSEWAAVGRLGLLPALVDLRLTSRSLPGGQDPVTTRSRLLATLPGLQVLNGSEVTGHERTDAERWYLQAHGHEWATVAAQPPESEARQAFVAQHSTFAALADRHGWQGPTAAAPARTTLRSKLLELTLLLEGSTPLVKRVPEGLTVGRLKAMVQAALKVPARAQRLCWADPEHGGRLVELGDDLRTLGFYQLPPSATVTVTST